jgi:hypothetical protein
VNNQTLYEEIDSYIFLILLKQFNSIPQHTLTQESDLKNRLYMPYRTCDEFIVHCWARLRSVLASGTNQSEDDEMQLTRPGPSASASTHGLPPFPGYENTRKPVDSKTSIFYSFFRRFENI